MAIPNNRSLARPAKDEWGVYDPQQAGLAALFQRLDTKDAPTPHATADVDPQRPCSGALTKGRPLFVRRRFVVRRPFAVNVF